MTRSKIHLSTELAQRMEEAHRALGQLTYQIGQDAVDEAPEPIPQFTTRQVNAALVNLGLTLHGPLALSQVTRALNVLLQDHYEGRSPDGD